MPLHQFYQYTPRQFVNYVRGVRFRESEIYKSQMEQMRLQAYWTARPHLKNQKLTPPQFMAFPWDAQPDSKATLSPEQKKAAAAAMWNRIDKSKKED